MNKHCKMCGIEFTPEGKLKEYQLFCDGKCFDYWLNKMKIYEVDQGLQETGYQQSRYILALEE